MPTGTETGNVLTLDNFDFNNYDKFSIEMLVKPTSTSNFVYMISGSNGARKDIISLSPDVNNNWQYLWVGFDRTLNQASYVINQDAKVTISIPIKTAGDKLFINGLGLIILITTSMI